MALLTKKQIKTAHKSKDKVKRFMTVANVVKKRKGGGTLVQSPAVFSDDSEYIYVNSGWGVRVFSVKTGQCVKVLETCDSEYGRVLSIMTLIGYPLILTINSSNQIYLLHWDPKSYVKRKVELKLPMRFETWEAVHGLLVPSVEDRSAQDLCLVVGKLDMFAVLFYDTTTADYLQTHPINGTNVGYSVGRAMLAFGGPPEMRIMASVVKDKGLCVYSLDGKKNLLECRRRSGGGGRGVHVDVDVQWVSVSCHPTEPSVAAGDSLGRCVLFRNPLLSPKVKTIFHWHTLPCDVITFTPAGSTMYTGGGEQVLVKWNVENPSVKHFLPRLSAPVVHISVSCDNSLVALSTLDNGIVLVDSSHRVKRVVQHMSWGVIPSDPRAGAKTLPFPAGLTFDPVSRSLLLNSRPGHLQFFCPDTETLTSVDISRQNYVTQERSKVIVNTDVTRVALTSDSVWMATVETRQESNVSLELRLKLWQYLISQKRWSLNSVVDMPHSGPVGCLKFRPVSSVQDSSSDSYLLVSTGNDAKFRLWSPTPVDSVYKKGVVWKCDGAASYKGRAVGPACFSRDGSLLAVAFEHITTLWSTDGLKFKTSLSRFLPRIRQIEFGSEESCSHLLVTASNCQVSVWNLLTLRLLWTTQVNSSILVSDPSSPFMALFSYHKNLYIFHPLFPESMHMEKNVCYPGVKILGATFAQRETINFKSPCWLQKSTLYYIDSNQELHCFEAAEEEEEVGGGVVDLVDDEERRTVFSDLRRMQSTSLVVKQTDQARDASSRHQYGQPGTAAIKQLVGSGGCHTMARVSVLCASLLAALALSKKSVKETERDEVDDDEDDAWDEGLGQETESESEEGPTSSNKRSEQPPHHLSNMSTPSVTLHSQPKSDQLFFIDLDDQVDNIINY